MAGSPNGTQGIPTPLPCTDIQDGFFPYWQVRLTPLNRRRKEFVPGRSNSLSEIAHIRPMLPQNATKGAKPQAVARV